MSLLDRYRKPGGFIQLVKLIETCNPAKREKFLQMIQEENRRWSEAVLAKMITLDKLFSWNQDALTEVFTQINDLTTAIALHGIEPSQREKVYRTMTASKKRKIDSLVETRQPTPAEIATAFEKIVSEVRQMMDEHRLPLERIDASMVIPSDIEDQLSSGGSVGGGGGGGAKPFLEPVAKTARVTMSNMAAVADAAATRGDASRPRIPQDRKALEAEVMRLHERNSALAEENQILKAQLIELRAKMESLRKTV